ncbi:hypothetical protein KDA82_23500 [Streptomyces daliensis]|uniref:Uncharacterized protein n=1 Tax=Streptomyces daliensis TaxID=299421 RepID=A0A8T4IW39_9ACTN|nr:hypothetical protein [Streptomyces daliensis]
MGRYVRFQGTSKAAGRRSFPGVFALVNTLAREGRLTPEQERFRRVNNDWYDASFTNPAHVDPTVYDPDVNPGATAWFKVTSTELIARVDGYLEILAAHGVECVRVDSSSPGRIVYEDADQVVVVPEAALPQGEGTRTGAP